MIVLSYEGNRLMNRIGATCAPQAYIGIEKGIPEDQERVSISNSVT